MSDNKPVINTNAPAPPGVQGEGFFAGKLSDIIGMARSFSLWPVPFATSCCGIEFMATMAPNYDLSRFGAERMSFSPRQADILLVCGTISKKLAPILKQVYTQMGNTFNKNGCLIGIMVDFVNFYIGVPYRNILKY